MPMIKLGRVVMVVLTVITLFRSSKAATTIYRVGGSSGWKVPSGYSYNDWAEQHTFVVGDVLEFDFMTGQHTVASVSLEDYDNCNIVTPLNVQTFGPANITLSLAQSYFICVKDGHCLRGQKLAVTVSNFGGSPYPIGNASPYFGYRNSATTIHHAVTLTGSLFLIWAFLF